MMNKNISPIKIWREAKNQHKYLGKTGNIVSFTQINAGPAGFEKQTPYWAGIMELQNGERIAGQIVNSEKKPAVKSKVIAILRRTREPDKKEIVQYGIKWRIL